MNLIGQGIAEAFQALLFFDREVYSIIAVSLKVSLSATIIASLIGVPLGVFIGQSHFAFKTQVTLLIHSMMSIPTVVIGLLVYGMLSRQGPLGSWGLLFTQPAMVIGQCLLALPIITGLCVNVMGDIDARVTPTLNILGANTFWRIRLLVREARFGILAAVTAGFARVFAEIGIAMMLGGNIRGVTRNMTTTIALESGKGNFSLGIALGLVMLIIALGVNILLLQFQKRAIK